MKTTAANGRSLFMEPFAVRGGIIPIRLTVSYPLRYSNDQNYSHIDPRGTPW